MTTDRTRRTWLTLTAAAVVLSPLATIASSPAAPNVRITKVRSVTLPNTSRRPGLVQADAGRQVIYLRHDDHVVSVNTTSGARTALPNASADNGMLLNRTTGDLYAFDGAPGEDDQRGLSIISGTQMLSRPGVGADAGINAGRGIVDIVSEPNDPEGQSYLLRFHGTTLLSKSAICNGLRDAAHGGNANLGYDATTGLLYVACGEWRPKHHFPRQQIFRGPTLIKTLNRHVNANYVQVDAQRDQVYVVGDRRLEVIHGTRVVGVEPIAASGRFLPDLNSSGLVAGSGDLYIGTPGKDGTVQMWRGTTSLGEASIAADAIAVDQRTRMTYIERETGAIDTVYLLSGPRLQAEFTTDALITGWDPVSGDVLAAGPDGLVAFRGDHIDQNVAVGGDPRTVVEDSGGHRIYTIAGNTLTVLRTAAD